MELHPFFQNPYVAHRNESVPQFALLGGPFPVLHRSLQLKQLSYEPLALLQRTRELFQYVMFNDVLQSSVKAYFGSVFLNLQQEPFIDESGVRLFTQLFDVFFFGGNLTGNVNPIVTLEFREDIFGQWPTYVVGRNVLWGRMTPQFTDIGTPRMAVRVNIELEAVQPQIWGGMQFTRRPIVRVLKTLVHEMVHAYLICFCCPCEICRIQIGGTGHGIVWRELVNAISREVATWDRSLQEFYIEDQFNLD